MQDEERMAKLEEQLKEVRNQAEDADKKYDEVARKLLQVEADLERAEERAEVGETKILELEEELRVVANNLRSLEVSEEKANQREVSYKMEIKALHVYLNHAEARAEFAEKSVEKLQIEVNLQFHSFYLILQKLLPYIDHAHLQVDRLEDDLMLEQEKHKAITEELEQTFAELSGY